MDLPHNHAVPIFGIYLKASISIDSCAYMSIAASFIIAKKDTPKIFVNWIIKMWYIYTMKYYSVLKNTIMG